MTSPDNVVIDSWDNDYLKRKLRLKKY